MFTRILRIRPAILYFSSGKVPDQPKSPDPTPIPTPAAQPGEVEASAESKRNKTAALKYGAMATIKNKGGASGISGVGADLSAPAAEKKTLGA